MSATKLPQDRLLLEKLLAALLNDDRKAVAEIQRILNSNEELAQRIDPIIETHLREL